MMKVMMIIDDDYLVIHEHCWCWWWIWQGDDEYIYGEDVD